MSDVIIMKVDSSRVNTVLEEYIEILEEKYKDAFAPAKLVVIPDYIDISVLPKQE